MASSTLAWLTDIHLNFLNFEGRQAFYQQILEANTDAILITGDIAESSNLPQFLSEFSTHTNKPIYFVLGNHDYYFGSIAEVRENLLRLCLDNPHLIWLGKPAVIPLTMRTVLVGFDGWADARHGDYEHTPISLNDSLLIKELAEANLINKSTLKMTMQQFADADANTLKEALHSAINLNPTNIIIATHVPPFAESCRYQDFPTDKNWLPFFVSKASGDVISDFARNYPTIRFLVLCGHTHTRTSLRLLDNLEAKVGHAQYSQPILQEVINVDFI